MKKTSTLLASAIALSLAACSGATGGDAAQEARTAFDRQDFIEARDKASVALEATPDDKALLLILAKSQVAIGQSDSALRALERLESIGGGGDDVSLLRSEALLQKGRPAQARDAIKGIDTSDAWRLRAIAAIHEKDDKAAEAAFASGMRAPGDRFKLHATQANWLVDHGFADRAQESVAKLQKIAPKRIETLFVTARLAQLQGDSATALASYQAILEQAPLDRPALLGAIAELGVQGRIDELRPLVARGLKAMPDDMEFIYLDARLEAESGNWKKVRSILQQVEPRLTDNPDARALYAQALLEEGQAELARSHLAPLYRAYPDAPGFAEIYAQALERTGDPEEARRVRAHAPVDHFEPTPA